MAKRIIILILVFLGVFFIWKSKNVTTPEETPTSVETEETKSETLLDKLKDEAKEVVEEPSSSAEASEDKEEVASPTEELPVYTPPKRRTVTEPVTPRTPVAPSGRKTTVKVYLYEWGVDISSKEIPSGQIAFEVQNNGRFSHDFAISGVKNFGKVRPGEVQVFTTNLRTGNFTVYSERGKDDEKGMEEDFSVITPLP